MKNICIVVILSLSSLYLSVATQADSWSINYQAYLTDEEGVPIDSTVTLQFNAYSSDIGGAPLWTEDQVSDVDKGLLTVTLGSPVNPFPLDLFDSSVFIGVTINSEELQPRRQLISSAFSFKAANAELLNGLPASNFDQSSDVQDLQDQALEQNDRLNAIETSPSDITEVIAGDGLSGGAQSGSATLNLALGGVTAANMSFNAITGGAIQAGAVSSIKIQDGSVAAIDLAVDSVNSSKIVDNTIASLDIADGSISPADINPQAGFTMRALFIQEDSTVNGDAIVGGDATIAQSIAVGSNAIIDGNTNIFGSMAVGLNIDAGNDITAGGDSTVAGDLVVGQSIEVGDDVNVSGSLGIGYVQVEKSLSTTGSAYSCNDEKSTCKMYSTSAVCPAGYLAVGGGVQLAVSSRGKILSNRPGDNNPGAWFCETQDSLNAPVDDVCYAVCLRIAGI